MEIRKLQLSLLKKKKGVISVFLIPEVGDMNSGVIIDEYYDKYEVTKVIFDNKIEQMEFASLIYEFVTSDYFLEDKPLYYLGSPIRCSKENEYPEIFQRLTPLFNQITV